MKMRAALVALPLLLLSVVACNGGGTDSDSGDQGDGDADADADADGDDGPPPTEAAELTAWLEEGSYESWPAEGGTHVSDGDHPGVVRTFVRPILHDSLNAGTTPHPVGSAAVKEIYDVDDVLHGWAVSVKIEEGGGTSTWYWYEEIGGEVIADAVADDLCIGCHAGATADHFLTPFPLQ